MTKRGPNPTDIYIGKRLALRRRVLGVSQTSLGQTLGITFQQIQKYEKGTNRISGSRLQALAEALQVPTNFFFDGAPNSSNLPETISPDFIDEFLSDRRGVEMARCFVKMTPKQRNAVVALAEALTADVSNN